MINFEGLDENFRFIVLEVQRHVAATHRFVAAPSRSLYDKITKRDDYIDNLKTIVENKCYSRIHTDKSLDARQVDRIRAMQVMCVNLERMADYCVNIVKQMQYLSDPSFIASYAYARMFDCIEESLGKILDGYHKEDMAQALAICKAEHQLDDQYKESFERILRELNQGDGGQDLVTVLFIFRYLERIGDALLNVGEALIFSILGERIKIEQFDALQQTLVKSGFGESLTDVDFSSIWGSRSGCRIGRVDRRPDKNRAAGDTHGGIYKEGDLDKIRKEKENIDRWRTIFPGLVAEVYGYHEEEDKGAMLVQFLPGCTLDEVILGMDLDFVANAMFVFRQTVSEIWSSTMKEEQVESRFMRQLSSRLESVRQVHPGFRLASRSVGMAKSLATDELLDRCTELETQVAAPFSVFTHGDFNANNVVYNHETQQVQLIDLYRSGQGDYVQDVSVFLVSNFRIPVMQDDLRSRLNSVIEDFHAFARAFAGTHGDAAFDARLAFGLARSFFTSTRFELNHAFAREMFQRAEYLMNKLCAHGGRWEEFLLPTDVLYY